MPNKAFMSVFLILAPHIAIILHIFNQYETKQENAVVGWCVLGFAILLALYIWLRINILPYSKKQIGDSRLRVLMGGRRLVLYGLFCFLCQILIYILSGSLLAGFSIPSYILISDIVITVLFVSILHTNGILRILFTSRRLNMVKKAVLASTFYIPVVHIGWVIYLSSVTKSEYLQEYYRVMNSNSRVESELCKTRYPLLLLHGAGFRDLRFINYWGRIPKELRKHGATLHYGNQEAWGTVENNAQFLKARVLEIVNQTGCEKVNIIAHSKGGLDARYMISKLEMGGYVASLTTLGTPHRGTRIIDTIFRLPKGVFKAFGKVLNKYCRLIGDKNPDVFTAVEQLSVTSCEKFNKEVPNVETVYYQSYATVMNHMFSDYVLAIPWLLLRLAEGKNDGLVSIESAKWGEFKGILKNTCSRGISHGDIIDLRRNDYKGFDAREQFVDIISDLKNRGL